LPDAPHDVDPDAYALIAGKYPNQAQRAVVEQLTEQGILIGEPRPLQHPVKFYERGDRPLEIVTSRQWYIRNGGRDADLRADLVARGTEMHWHPGHMQHRYDNWVEGLNGDWLVSRQRFFGVPVPIWYRLDAAGEPIYDEPLLPSEDLLPIDPSTDLPNGFTADQRDQPNGFAGDPDILDTWATSSLTPQIAGHWEEGDGPRSADGFLTRTARRCRSRRATLSPRWTCSTSTALTPCATGLLQAARASTPRTAKIR
jgi:valyl-tRNA synthetase